MPIEVKLSKGEISFRHPDSQRWVRGRRLGTDYTAQNLGISPPACAVSYTKQKTIESTH